MADEIRDDEIDPRVPALPDLDERLVSIDRLMLHPDPAVHGMVMKMNQEVIAGSALRTRLDMVAKEGKRLFQELQTSINKIERLNKTILFLTGHHDHGEETPKIEPPPPETDQPADSDN